LIEDRSVLGLACQHIHCGFLLRSEYFQSTDIISFPVILESKDLIQYYMTSMSNSTESTINYNNHRVNVILEGYNSGERFWEKVPEAESCGRELSGCQNTEAEDDDKSYMACINGYAISQFMIGPVHPPSDTRSLLGLHHSSQLFQKTLYYI